jgi:hypothetical protein
MASIHFPVSRQFATESIDDHIRTVDAKDFGLRVFQEIRERLKAKEVWHIDISPPGGRLYIAQFAGPFPGKNRLWIDITESGNIEISYLAADGVVFPHSKLVDLTPSDVADVVVGKRLPPFPEETTPLSEAKTSTEAVDIIFNYFCRVLVDRGVKLVISENNEESPLHYEHTAMFFSEYKGKRGFKIYNFDNGTTIRLSKDVVIEFASAKKTSCKDLFSLVFEYD